MHNHPGFFRHVSTHFLWLRQIWWRFSDTKNIQKTRRLGPQYHHVLLSQALDNLRLLPPDNSASQSKNPRSNPARLDDANATT